MDIVTLTLAKKYANKLMGGYTKVEVDGMSIIFTLIDGKKVTLTVPKPKDGVSIVDISVNEEKHLICTLSDGSKVDAGEVPNTKGDKGDKDDTGEKGDAFVYEDFTPEQLASLQGPKGDQGNDGYTPIKGVDYFTESEVTSVETNVLDNLNPQIEGIRGQADDAVEKAEQAEAIAKGKSTGYVFDTKEAMETWLSDNKNKEKLLLGDNLYIRAVSVPDFWWDGNNPQPLETQKVDLTDYLQKSDIVYEAATETLIIG